MRELMRVVRLPIKVARVSIEEKVAAVGAARVCRSHKIRNALRGRMWTSAGCESFECQWWLSDCCRGRKSA
jgi:hypothetical protein